MRIVFIGTVKFSRTIFRHLIFKKESVVGLVTSPVSSTNADYVDLSVEAGQAGIPVFRTTQINSEESLEWIRDLKPDIVLCLGWSRLLKEELLAIPRFSVIGYHPAELPMNRGRHPLIWALVLGLTKTASTFFMMNVGADDGAIVSQVPIEVTYDDNARSLYNKVSKVAIGQIDNILAALHEGNLVANPQDESLANSWRKRGPMDGRIDFRMSSRMIYNLVRGLTHPYVGAHFDYQGNQIKLWQVREVADLNLNYEPGRVIFVDGDIVRVKCGEGAIEIEASVFKETPVEGDYLI